MKIITIKATDPHLAIKAAMTQAQHELKTIKEVSLIQQPCLSWDITVIGTPFCEDKVFDLLPLFRGNSHIFVPKMAMNIPINTLN